MTQGYKIVLPASVLPVAPSALMANQDVHLFLPGDSETVEALLREKATQFFQNAKQVFRVGEMPLDLDTCCAMAQVVWSTFSRISEEIPYDQPQFTVEFRKPYVEVDIVV